MYRTRLKMSGLAIAFWATGCCMCDAPYDYCNPTFLGGPCDECVIDARRNSAFTPFPGPWVAPLIPPPPQQSALQPSGEQPQPMETSPSDMPAPAGAPMPEEPMPGRIPRSTTQTPRPSLSFE